MPRLLQLLVSCLVITLIAMLGEHSRKLASIVAVFPVNILLASWFVYTATDGGAPASADFLRMTFFGLSATMLFYAAGWYGFSRGWSPGRVLLLSSLAWLTAIGIYQLVGSWFKQT